MNIIDININKLKEYENNPRFNDNAVDTVAKSINDFGFKVPIVIDKNNIIVAGHTRLKAAKQLGLEKVPCLVADDLTEEQIKAFRLVDNKTSELAEWDFTKLEEELLNIHDIDMSDFEFNLDIEEIKNEEKERIDLSDDFEVKFEIKISCKDEIELQDLYEEFMERGLECKII